MPALRRASLFLLLVLVPVPGHGTESISPNQPIPAEFVDYVNYYAALQRMAVTALGPPLMSPNGEQVLRQQMRFANAMRAARPAARAGDVFTPAVARYFRTRIETIVRATDLDLAPPFEPPDEHEIAVDVVPRVSEAVPWHAGPVMWPSMLAGLPELPTGLEYRFLGRHLIIIDSLAGLVVDALYDALPEPEFSSS